MLKCTSFFHRKTNNFLFIFFSTRMEFGSLKRKGQPKHPSWAPKPWSAPSHDSATWPLTRWTSQPANSPMLDGRLRYLSINLKDRDLSEGLCDWFSAAIFCSDWMNQNVIGLIKAGHLFLKLSIVIERWSATFSVLVKCNYARSLLHSCGF